MPTYIYKCEKCEGSFKTFHGMNDILTECSECHHIGSIKKIPSLLNSLPERDKEKEAAGTRVKEAIEDNRKLLLDSQNDYKNRTM